MLDWRVIVYKSLPVIVFTIIILVLVKMLVRRLNKSIDGTEGLSRERRQQTKTFIQIVAWIVSVSVICIGVLMLLSYLGVDLTPLLASAGIAGLALSLGAQTLIKDYIGGFIILAENQFVVGDDIQLETLSGQVERITLRATYVRDIHGIQYIVPNGEIRIVANQNKEWANAIAEVNVAYEDDLTMVTEILKKTADTYASESEFRQDILGESRVIGPVAMGEWAVTMRVSLKVRPEIRLEVSRELQKVLLSALKEQGIEKPYPRSFREG